MADSERAGRLIELLLKENDRKGYLGPDSIEKVSRTLSIPASRPFAVAAQLEYFDLDAPPGSDVNVCCGPACELAGSRRIYDGETKPSAGAGGTRVRCFLGSPFWHLPVLVQARADGELHFTHGITGMKAPAVEALLGEIRAKGAKSLSTSIDDRLAFLSAKGTHLSTPPMGSGRKRSLEQLVEGDGHSLATWVSDLDALRLLKDIDAAGITDTATGVLLSSLIEQVRGARQYKRIVVCDVGGMEPENSAGPMVAASDPLGLMRGMMAAAVACEASSVLIFVPYEDVALRAMFRVLVGGIAQYLTGFGFSVNLLTAPNLIPCDREIGIASFFRGLTLSEATALAARSREDLWGARALFAEPEVFTGLSKLASEGAKPFKAARGGGTRVVTIGGKVQRPRMVELPVGISLGDAIDDFAGGMRRGSGLKAIHVGGTYGGPMKPSVRRSSIKAVMRRHPDITGSQLLAIDQTTCIVQWAEYFAALAERLCCGACSTGRLAPGSVLRLLGRIRAGEGRLTDLDEIAATVSLVTENALCPQAARALNAVSVSLADFRSEFEEHVTDRRCAAHVCWP